ncbi:hypothetical protein [Conexibacter sp. CPCC 206217]|uniref:hypothetical protein n=1 Tax=Conexibacter sp. CPCC 206217 TaxID=3064574 RepID=UPI00271CA50A|nr:hypothetical protein [Conexibacter sp. CPCC 206217]MDO8211843.1 hypothetical protein [Conexibacter sp. CPCC 206217]
MANRAKPTGNQTNRGSSTGDASRTSGRLWSERRASQTLLGSPGTPQPCHPPTSPVSRETGIDARETGALLRESDNVSALHARSAGADTRLVGLAWTGAYQAVIALPGAGIHEPAQLAGRRLGLPRCDTRLAIDVDRVAASRGVHAATALACLFCDEYERIDVEDASAGGESNAAASELHAGGGPYPDEPHAIEPYAAEVVALLAGTVDAIYVAGEAGRALARRIGAVEVVDLGAHLDPMVRVNAATPLALTVDARQLRLDPERVARELAARLRADEARPARGRCGLDAAIDLSQQSLAALGAQNDWLLTQGFVGASVDLAGWVERGPLEAARTLVA